MTVRIPNKKSEVLQYKGRPALNVKHYGRVEYTAERIVAEFGCSKDTAERAAERVYNIAREVFWEDAHELLKHAFGAGHKVWAEGRSGGWLIADGLGAVEDWDGPTLQKWRKFARLVSEDMDYRAGWEFAADMIVANEMAPKVGTVEANREQARAQPLARLAEAALGIHGELDGQEWNADTLNRCADHLRKAGLAINAYDPEADADAHAE